MLPNSVTGWGNTTTSFNGVANRSNGIVMDGRGGMAGQEEEQQQQGAMIDPPEVMDNDYLHMRRLRHNPRWSIAHNNYRRLLRSMWK